MSQKHQNRKNKTVNLSSKRRRIPIFVSTFILLLIGIIAIVGLFLFYRPSKIAEPVVLKQPIPQQKFVPHYALKNFSRQAQSLQELTGFSVAKMSEVDIAEMNLLCIQNLPGGYGIDINRCLARLDEWAKRVQFETERHLYRVTDPRFAEHYHHSETYYRAEMLLQVLQEDCGVKYNPERIFNVDFTNSKDLFIHGMIDDSNGGTCASMPVLYVAVGRRLGYPLYLVQTKGHLFMRWDDGKNRFNIEGSGNGISSFPDEYYYTWPFQLTEYEKQSGQFLVSLTPAQEFAAFLATRGHCLYDTKNYNFAGAAFSYAMKFDPFNLLYPKWFQLTSRAMCTPENNPQNLCPNE
ncbi:MAG: transglutaminase-like domain-containing protein [Planctomycetaceae bacterium]|jgi:hypothetical protein|nr:transglutaminase-like domain-containing protein [Planctomycetaceae bacterium]